MARLAVLRVSGVACALPSFGGEIHTAIEAGNAARVAQIQAADPGAVSERDDHRFRNQPIHVAATTGKVESARMLLDAGADVDAGDSDNSTGLGIAATRRHGELVALLLERGGDVNRRDRKADCPLSFTVYGRDEAIIQLVRGLG